MIDVRIVAVPERLQRAEQLAHATGGSIILDTDGIGAFRNHINALRSATASHVVVLEDDAILCPDFTEHVAGLVAERPHHLIGLYVGRHRPPKVQQALAHLDLTVDQWLDSPDVVWKLHWAVGYVMPTADIPDVVRMAEADAETSISAHTDRRLGLYHAAEGRLSYPIPSPLNHDISIRSAITRNRRGKRVAWRHCERTPA